MLTKLCSYTNCNKSYETKDRRSKFCSRSCAGFGNQQTKGHRISSKIPVPCKSKICTELTTNPAYCSLSCQHTEQWLNKKIEIEKGNVSDPKTLRKYFFEKQGTNCLLCNRNSWEGKAIPLVLDHIDGDSSNNNINNLRLICPNCDALLPTFKNRNKGNGRHSRRERYSEGKSY